jgi:hypothetical protein
MGIFYKDCPQCASTHAATTVRCGCGYHFDPDQVDSDDARLELAVHEEQLYEAYLSARLSQARDAVGTARRLHRQDPKDDNRTQTLRDAEERLKAAEAELAIQREKTALLMRVAKGMRCDGTPEKTERLATVEDRARLIPDTKQAGAKPRTRKKRSAGERSSHRRPSPRPDRADALPPVPVLTETAESASATAAFRAAQERLARAAIAAERARLEAAPQNASPDPVKMPATVRTRIAARAETIVANRNMRECPNCFARVPDDLSVCGCGLTLANAPTEMPPMMLEAGEKKTLHESALAAWISRRR